MKASGNSTRPAPPAAASVANFSTLASVAAQSKTTGAAWITATRLPSVVPITTSLHQAGAYLFMCLLPGDIAVSMLPHEAGHSFHFLEAAGFLIAVDNGSWCARQASRLGVERLRPWDSMAPISPRPLRPP